jgi:murein L,D-transpeptidase YcbB/YkuD
VNLGAPIRVYIVYGTAIARDDGSILFLEDLYGLEKNRT